jgi:hypothetical protein
MDVLFRLALPVDLLDVLVHLLCQIVAAFQASTLEDITATLRGHAFAETVDASPTTNFWLIRSFWHYYLPQCILQVF